MKVRPIGNITNVIVLSPPVATDAIAFSPRSLTCNASANVITDWLMRASTIGSASVSKVTSRERIGGEPCVG